jgi:TonB family protein
MRNAVVALLSLSSCMLSAQAATPAQSQDAGNGTAQIRRISTGVTAPKLVYKVDVVADSPEAARMLNQDTKVVVSMIVDKSGKPSDLKIVQSAGASVDASVLAAVSQYRFAPGTVSNQPIATPLNLEVLISNSYR